MSIPLPDEDGHALWLRHAPLEGAAARAWQGQLTTLVPLPGGCATAALALQELQRGLAGLLGASPVLRRGVGDGALLLATPEARPALRRLGLPLEALGSEGFLLRAVRWQARRVWLLAANGERGLLYGAFALLRALATGATPQSLALQSAPAVPLRILDHWDNLDRTVERGYAGQSIWDWWKLPHILDARYTDYARAQASLGVNGVVLNNVNAKPEILTAPWIAKAAALADVFRPWGLRVHLSVRFSTPLELGECDTADPRAPAVQRWWRDKAREVWRAIPDFGGFLVKANSEGQPGPRDYGCSHADGANLIADAVAPLGGVVMWRAFVYAAENPVDRARQAFDEFLPLDGQFRTNVVVQVKNGPIDFQPREPFHPLFGALQRTPLMAELMVTKEYMGFSTHLAYQGSVYEELMRARTHRPQDGSTVADTIAGVAGVGNVGSDRNWCGSHFDQAHWYAWGRMAWAPTLSARAVATEWAQQTFTRKPRALRTIVGLLMASREAVVDCMTPLGLHHLMATGHHHGPGPWVGDLKRPEWNPTYYHQAGPDGIGFARGPQGSNAVAQYAAPLAQAWSDPATTPEPLLLWFHHLPWTHRMRSGRTLWAELVAHYDRGVAEVEAWPARWAALRREVDGRRHAEVAAHLAQQVREARWWRDACVAYFREVSGRRLPPGTRPPARPLADYRAMRFAFAPGCGG